MFTVGFKTWEGYSAGPRVVWYETLEEARKALNRDVNILINENICDLAEELCILDESGRIVL